MELGHPDICVHVCVVVAYVHVCHLFQGTTCVLAACLVGDSLHVSVFVDLSVWTKCLRLGGLGAVVDVLLFLLMCTFELECHYFSNHNSVQRWGSLQKGGGAA